MQLLAIETSTDACSIALYRDGEIWSDSALLPKLHATHLLPMIEALLVRAHTTLQACQAIAFGRGPGSFTGVRMAAGVAQGLAFGSGRPVVPVSTLAALAWEARKQIPGAHYVATLDARMHEMYWAIYADAGAKGVALLEDERLSAYSDLQQCLADQPSQHFVVCGPGWHAYAPSEQALAHVQVLASSWPSAIAIAEYAAAHWDSGMEMSPEQGLPHYVRDNVAVKSVK